MSLLLRYRIGMMLTITRLLMSNPILQIPRTPEGVLSDASSYLFITLPCTMITIAYNAASSILRVFADGKTPQAAMSKTASSNYFFGPNYFSGGLQKMLSWPSLHVRNNWKIYAVKAKTRLLCNCLTNIN